MDNQNDINIDENGLSIEDYLDIILRRKWLIIIPFFLSVFITTFVYSSLPKIYRSDTLILVIPQIVPEDYVKPTITTPIGTRLTSISDEILSRTRLETIINEFNLYQELRKSENMEQIVAKMREDIILEIREPKRGETTSSFKIYYQGKNPETVRKVTRKLASLFIEENLKTREQQARITTEFLNKELASAKGKLEELENKITEFKFKHLGNLPEQNDANLEMLSQLAERRQDISNSIIRAENRELIIRRQISRIKEFLDDEEEETGPSLEDQLESAKNELLVLKSTYTENHIEVKKVQERIKQLKDQIASSEKVLGEDIHKTPSRLNPEALDLKTQLIVTQKEIALLKKEKDEIQKQIAVYEKRIEEVPRVELNLSSLKRDYENTKEFYEELLHKKLEAEQAENLEKRQQGEQFRILDPASLPRMPFKPNPKKVFPIGILLGLFTGCGLVFYAEKLDRSFKNVKEAERYLGVPILAAIPFKKEQKT